MATTDFIPSLVEIRALFIPNYDPEELAGFPDAFQWLKHNLVEFFQAGFAGSNESPLGGLPENVLNHHDCLSFWLELLEDVSSLDLQKKSLVVAYTPGSSEWQTDFILQTNEAFVALKDHPPELGTCDPNVISTSRTISIIQAAFDSNWTEQRQQAGDLLTAQLFRRYWAVLKRRVKTYCV